MTPLARHQVAKKGHPSRVAVGFVLSVVALAKSEALAKEPRGLEKNLLKSPTIVPVPAVIALSPTPALITIMLVPAIAIAVAEGDTPARPIIRLVAITVINRRRGTPFLDHHR